MTQPNFKSKIFKSLKKKVGISFCNICLRETRVEKFDKLELCHDCLKKVKDLESKGDFSKIPKENVAGGIKDEL